MVHTLEYSKHHPIHATESLCQVQLVGYGSDAGKNYWLAPPPPPLRPRPTVSEHPVCSQVLLARAPVGWLVCTGSTTTYLATSSGVFHQQHRLLSAISHCSPPALSAFALFAGDRLQRYYQQKKKAVGIDFNF